MLEKYCDKLFIEEEIKDILSKIYKCGLPENREKCCEIIFTSQKKYIERMTGKLLEIGLVPSPIFGSLNAPVAFIAINPGINIEYSIYYDKTEKIDCFYKFNCYALNCIKKHEILKKYSTKTSKLRNEFLKRLQLKLGIKKTLSLEKGDAFTANVVQCPTKNWAFSMKDNRNNLASHCSEKYLKNLLSMSKAKILIVSNDNPFDWLVRRVKSKNIVLDGGEIKIEDGKELNNNKMSPARFLGRRVAIVIQSFAHMMYGGDWEDNLVSKGFIEKKDFSYTN